MPEESSAQQAASSFLTRAVRNFIYSGVGTAAQFAIGFLFAGLTIRYLGEARAGYFMALAALTGLNALLGDFGLGTPAVRRVAILNAKGDLYTARLVVGSVCTASFASGLVVALSIMVFFPSVFEWSRLDVVYRGDAFWATFFTLGSFILTQASNPWRATYTALERYDLISALNTVFGMLQGVLGIAILTIIPTMAALAVVRLSLSLARFLVDSYFMRRLLHGVPWPTWVWREIRPMLSFGGWVYVGNTGLLLLGRVNSLILTTFLGSAALPYYELPQRIFGQVHTALDSQSRFLFPMFASYGDDAITQIKRLEDRLRWLVALASGALYTAIALVGPDLLGRVVSPEFGAQVRLPLVLACVQGFFEAQAIVPYFASWAVGSGKPNAIKELVQGSLVALAAFLLIPRLGFVGASVAQLWGIPVVIIHTLWVRRLVWRGADPWGWLHAMASPSLMIITWILTLEAGLHFLSLNPTMFYLLVVLGGGLGLAVVWLVERLMFPRKERWETLTQATQVLLQYMSPRRLIQEARARAAVR